jgi:hypothetical protein
VEADLESLARSAIFHRDELREAWGDALKDNEAPAERQLSF